MKKTVIEYVEYGVDELTYSDFSKAAERLFYKINIGKFCVLSSP